MESSAEELVSSEHLQLDVTVSPNMKTGTLYVFIKKGNFLQGLSKFHFSENYILISSFRE